MNKNSLIPSATSSNDESNNDEESTTTHMIEQVCPYCKKTLGWVEGYSNYPPGMVTHKTCDVCASSSTDSHLFFIEKDE